MTFGLERILERFGGLRALVIGDVMLDSYLEGASTRLCPEAPVPVVAVARQTDAPGGAANVAANVRALGAQVTLIGVVGDDAAAAGLRRALEQRGVAAGSLVRQAGRRTLAKRRVIGNAHLMLRFDEGGVEPVSPAAERALIEAIVAAYRDADAVIVADYGYGALTPRALDAIRLRQRVTPRPLLADAKAFEPYRDVGITVAKPNYAQALRLAGGPGPGGASRAAAIAERAPLLLERTGAGTVVVTLDADGAIVLERGRAPHRVPARATRQARAAGAGDTFGSVFALACAAGVVIAKDGTATCAAGELRDALRGQSKRVASLERLAAELQLARGRGARIVLTNGCFDLLHRGHIRYLNRARELGDLLVVGLNTDEGVRRLKGAGRPINGLDDRAEVLAGLSCVDHVVAFDEDTPVALIRALRPDVFVKGGDYTRETLPEAPVVEELGGLVRILPFIEDRSTTGIIHRIRSAEPEPGVRTGS